jgi:hypothetical protein
MVRIKLLIAVYDRIDITKIVYQNLHDVLPKGVDVLIVGHEKAHKTLAIKYGFEWFEHDNIPVGRKLNAAMLHGLKSNWDYMMQLGSDDIVSPDLFTLYEGLQHHVYGIDNCIMWHNGNAHKFTYNGGAILGAGRMISREAVERAGLHVELKLLRTISNANYMLRKNTLLSVPMPIAESLIETGHGVRTGHDVFGLWCEKNKGLDTCSQKNLSMVGYDFTVIPSDALLVDIKSAVNITNIDGLNLPICELPTWAHKYIMQ